MSANTAFKGKSSWAAGSDAVAVLHGERLWARGSGANSVDELEADFAALDALTLVELESSITREGDALVLLETEVLSGGAELLGALSVGQFVTSSALNLVAFSVEEAEASRAGLNDALVSNKLGASRAFGDDASALSSPLVTSLAVLVASTLEESETLRAAGSDALTLDEGEAVLDVAGGGDALSFLDLPSLRALQGNTVSVLEGVADGASSSLALSADQDEAFLAAVNVFSGARLVGSGGGGRGGSSDTSGSLLGESFRAASFDAGLVFELVARWARGDDTLAVLELRARVANHLEAILTLDGVANWARNSDALVSNELEVLAARGSGANAIVHGESFLALLVADTSDDLVTFRAADSNALVVNQLVVLVAGSGDASIANLGGAFRALLDGANSSGAQLEALRALDAVALVVLQDSSGRALGNHGLDALAANQDEAILARVHDADSVLKLEAFLASVSLALEGLVVESEKLWFTAAHSVALLIDELLAGSATNSDAQVLGLLDGVDQLEVLRAANLGADTVLEILASSAGLDALTVDQGVSDGAVRLDAGLGGDVVSVAGLALDSGAFAESVLLEARSTDNFGGLSNLEASTVLEGVSGLAADNLAATSGGIESAVRVAADASVLGSLEVANWALDLADTDLDALAVLALETSWAAEGGTSASSEDESFRAGGSLALTVDQREVLGAGGQSAAGGRCGVSLRALSLASVIGLLVTSRARNKNALVLSILGVASLANNHFFDVNTSGSSALLVDLALEGDALSTSQDLVGTTLDDGDFGLLASLSDWVSLESTWAELEALSSLGGHVAFRALLDDDRGFSLGLDALVQNAVILVAEGWAGDLEAAFAIQLVASRAGDSDALS